MVLKKSYHQDCPIARTLDIIGDRWTLLLIRDLFMGKKRFNELLRSCPGVPPKLLSERLKRLEGHKLIERLVQDGYPPRAEYQLTAKGRSLFPVLRDIAEWGVEHLYEDDPEMARSIAHLVRSQVPEFQDEEGS